jgi:hypothetical protein
LLNKILALFQCHLQTPQLAAQLVVTPSFPTQSGSRPNHDR